MYGRQWLGDVTSDFAAAKLEWEQRHGIAYTGNATTAEQLQAEEPLLTRIANQDVTAYVEGWHHSDPAVRSIALNYLKHMADYDQATFRRLAAAGTIDAETYQAVTGNNLVTEYWFREAARNRFTADVYATIGAHNRGNLWLPIRFEGQTDWTVNVTGNYNDGRPYEMIANSADPDAMAKVLTWWAGYVASAAPKTVAVAPPQVPSAPEPEGPPSGWRYNGVDGWWGPDGLFYPGNASSTPWDGNTQGISITTFTQPPPPAPAPTVGPPPIESGGGPTVETGGGEGYYPPHPPEESPPVFPPEGVIPPPAQPPAQPGELPPEGEPRQTASIFGTGLMPILLGGGLLAAVFFSKKRGR